MRLSAPPHKLETDWAGDCDKVMLRRYPLCERDSIIGRGRRGKQAHDEDFALCVIQQVFRGVLGTARCE
jgi:hypothetical protein